jgi:hypothetical protein
MEKKIEIGIYMVATKKYISLWKLVVDQLNDLLKNDPYLHVTIMLATDQEELANDIAKQYERIDLVPYAIAPLGWPEATLLRYELLLAFDNFEKFDLCMYLDSDMVIHKLFFREALAKMGEAELGMVIHPGFAICRSGRGIIRGITDPKIIKSIVGSLFRQPFRLGTWETNRHSTAYVPRHKRRVYVHGAIWFGKPSGFKRLCEVLATNVRKDLANGIVAIWHDESHLNWFTSKNRVALLNSEYSWVESYRNINHLNPFVSTYSKDTTFR